MNGVRHFAIATLVGVLGLVGCTDLPPESASDQLLGGSRLRVMAGNLTSGNGQNYDLGHGIRIFQGVAPDVALVQEMEYTGGLRAFVDTAFGAEYGYVIGTGNIPNGIVSRYPIIAGGEWDDPQVSDRGFTWAQIDIPGETDLYAVSIHLLTRSATARDAEARELVTRIKATVPAGQWLVVGGDFNTDSRTESALRTLAGVVTTSGPYPVDRNNNGHTNASRSKPYDWVLASPDLDAREIPVEIGANTFANGLVVDTRVHSPIADLSPALVNDSGAASMQHMGVVRDFDIPTDVQASVHVDTPNGGETFEVGSTVTIRWSTSNLDTVDLEYAADGVTFTTFASSVVASSGAWDWTVPGPATTQGRVRIVGAGIDDVSDAAFTIVDASPPPPPPPPPPGVVHVLINEVLANEPGTATSGEAIEVMNIGDAAADLSGWSIADGIQLRHRFPAGTTLAAGARLVVWGNTASTGALGLSNSGDTAKLVDANGTIVDSHSFGSSPDGVSFNRSPDATTGGFVLHTQLSSASSSPGTAP